MAKKYIEDMEIIMEKKIFCKSGGCSAKLGAGVLDHVLAKLPRKEDKNLLVGMILKMMLQYINYVMILQL